MLAKAKEIKELVDDENMLEEANRHLKSLEELLIHRIHYAEN